MLVPDWLHKLKGVFFLKSPFSSWIQGSLWTWRKLGCNCLKCLAFHEGKKEMRNSTASALNRLLVGEEAEFTGQRSREEKKIRENKFGDLPGLQLRFDHFMHVRRCLRSVKQMPPSLEEVVPITQSGSGIASFAPKWKAAHVCMLNCFTCVQLCATLRTVDAHCAFVHGNSPGKNAGVGCHALFQGGCLPLEENFVIHGS